MFLNFVSFQNQTSPRTQSSIVSNGLSGSASSIPQLIQNTSNQQSQLNLVINIQQQQQQQQLQSRTQQQQSPPQHMDYNQSQSPPTNVHQKLNVAKALSVVQQAQQQQLLHSALTRAVSQPVGGQQAVQLLNSINEILGHKKLERTQSEPLPQLNTSR